MFCLALEQDMQGANCRSGSKLCVECLSIGLTLVTLSFISLFTVRGHVSFFARRCLDTGDVYVVGGCALPSMF